MMQRRSMARLGRFLLACILLQAALSGQNARAREAAARQELEVLEKTAQTLPPAAKPLRSVLPVPQRAALTFGRQCREFAKLYIDLPESLAARRLAATADLVSGDPAAAIAESLAVAESAKDPALKIAALELVAEQSALYGDFAGASKAAEDLSALDPLNKRAVEWTAWLAKWKTATARQSGELAAFKAGLSARDERERLAALQLAARFAISAPLHLESSTFLRQVTTELEAGDISDTLPYHERIALYSPRDPGWISSTSRAAAALFVEGEYERAVQHLLHLLERSQELPPSEVGRLGERLQAAETVWARVLARDLDVLPKTKSTRFHGLTRMLERRLDVGDCEEALVGFEQDYPTCSELPKIRLLAARCFAEERPDLAIQRAALVIADRRAAAMIPEALDISLPIVEGTAGPDAAEKLLAKTVGQVADPAARLRFGLERVRLLEVLERFEDALGVLEAMAKDTAADGAKDKVEAAVHRVKARLDG